MFFETRYFECMECKSSFAFTVDEQKHYHREGYKNPPKRCWGCRERRYGTSFELYPIRCKQCGKWDKVPFPPFMRVGVLCRECYKVKQNK